MARLEAARQRLERAIELLEQAVSERAVRRNGDDPALRQALDAISHDYASLQEITHSVRRRLDLAIGRLEHLLEH